MKSNGRGTVAAAVAAGMMAAALAGCSNNKDQGTVRDLSTVQLQQGEQQERSRLQNLQNVPPQARAASQAQMTRMQEAARRSAAQMPR